MTIFSTNLCTIRECNKTRLSCFMSLLFIICIQAEQVWVQSKAVFLLCFCLSQPSHTCTLMNTGATEVKAYGALQINVALGPRCRLILPCHMVAHHSDGLPLFRIISVHSCTKGNNKKPMENTTPH